jgi:signal-transduction protein with cAMP-binding, CBS, and nucleotidyltransferase domain
MHRWIDVELIVKELMSTSVCSIGTEATVKEAAGKMAHQEIGSLVVIEQSRPVGIVTERDLLSRVLALGRKGDVVQVKTIMSQPLICGTPDMDVSEATQFMIRRGIKKLPIVQDGRMIGILTLTDVCAAQPDMVGVLEEETRGKLPKRFMKRLAKRYYKT